MKQTLLAVALTLLAVASTLTPEQKIVQLEREWMEAMKARDAGALDRLMAPEFALGGVGDFDRPLVPRALWIDNTMKHLTVDSVDFGKTQVRVAGDTAVFHATFTWSGAYDRERFTDTVVLVDTWVKRGGKWQVVSRLIGDLPSPTPPPAAR